MGKIKKIVETDLVGGSTREDVYPVTSIRAVYDTKNRRLDDLLKWGGLINLTEKYGNSHDAIPLENPLGKLVQKVPQDERMRGFFATYKTLTGWKLVKYDGESIEDTHWNNINNWSEVSTSGGGSEDLSGGLGNDPNATINQKALSEMLAQIPRWQNIIFPEISWFDGSLKMGSYETLIYVNTLVRRSIREIAYIGDISLVHSIKLTDLRIMITAPGESSLGGITINAKIVVEHGKNITGTNTFTLSNKTIIPTLSNTKDVVIYTLSGGDDIDVQMKIAFSIFDLKTILYDNDKSFDMTVISIQPFIINPLAIANKVNYPNIAGKDTSGDDPGTDSFIIVAPNGAKYLSPSINYIYNPSFPYRFISNGDTTKLHSEADIAYAEFVIKALITGVYESNNNADILPNQGLLYLTKVQITNNNLAIEAYIKNSSNQYKYYSGNYAVNYSSRNYILIEQIGGDNDNAAPFLRIEFNRVTYHKGDIIPGTFNSMDYALDSLLCAGYTQF